MSDGKTMVERHRKKPKGWRGDSSRHSEAEKRAWKKRRRNAAEKAARTPPTKKEVIKAAKKASRRKRGLPEGDGK